MNPNIGRMVAVFSAPPYSICPITAREAVPTPRSLHMHIAYMFVVQRSDAASPLGLCVANAGRREGQGREPTWNSQRQSSKPIISSRMRRQASPLSGLQLGTRLFVLRGLAQCGVKRRRSPA